MRQPAPPSASGAVASCRVEVTTRGKKKGGGRGAGSVRWVVVTKGAARRWASTTRATLIGVPPSAVGSVGRLVPPTAIALLHYSPMPQRVVRRVVGTPNGPCLLLSPLPERVVRRVVGTPNGPCLHLPVVPHSAKRTTVLMLVMDGWMDGWMDVGMCGRMDG